MKKYFIVFMMLGWMINTQAQQNSGKSPEQKATQMTGRLTKSLALTAEQQSKIYPIALNNIQAMEQARAGDPNDKKAFHARIKALRQSYESEVKSVLTQEQAAQWDQIKQEQKSRHKQKSQAAAPVQH
jgi:protein CpxP